MPLLSRAFSQARGHFGVLRVLARRNTKKERLPVVYNKTALHVLVVKHNHLTPSLIEIRIRTIKS